MVAVLDLFAGAGGWDLAIHGHGWDADGVEIMPQAQATRDAAGLSTIHDDVWTLPDHVTGIGRYQGIVASPPCQTFSQAGRGSGRKALDNVLAVLPYVGDHTLAELRHIGEKFGDERTALVLTPLWYALHNRPGWVAWEQVPSVLPVWEACAHVLRMRGWSVWTGHLQAEQYGVPQTRRRAFLIANRHGDVGPPTPTHSRYYPRTPGRLDPGVLPWVSMAEGLGWGMTERPYPTIAPGVGQGGPDALMVGGSGARRIVYREYDEGRWHPRDVTPDGEPRWRDQSGTPVDKAWPDKRPATTVAGRGLVQNPGETANRRNTSTKSRNDGVRVSVCEAGVLQAFPPDFPWQGNRGRQYLQVGNAVPPLMAAHVLNAAINLTPRPVVVAADNADVPLW